MKSPMNITIVHCWSAPRSRSTALLYSFEARGSTNCIAIDEPLYRKWLEYYFVNDNHSNDVTISRPYANELIKGIPHSTACEEDYFKWSREIKTLEERILDGANKLFQQLNVESAKNECTNSSSTNNVSPVIFVKHMAKHSFLYNFNNEHQNSKGDDSQPDFVLIHKHVLLIRDPVAILSSWNVAKEVHNSISSDEVGIIQLLSIYSTLSSLMKPVVILDSDSLANDPDSTLKSLCQDLDIHYTDSMLTWSRGKHDCDGPWAPWWYTDVHKSNGWMTKQTSNGNHFLSNRKYRSLDQSLMHVLKSSMPAYTYLLSLTSKYRTRGPRPSQIYEDPRNANIIVYIGSPGHGRLVPRDMAGISPWDSSVQGGDATWEGIRIYRGKIFKLERHLKRLFKSAKALGFENIHTKDEVIDAIFRTLAVNNMRDGVHMRLTLTRGEKYSSSMNPKFNVYGTTLIILPEWKPIEGATTYDNKKGISLITSSIRRNSPSTCDSKIHHNNMINNILPKIQANLSNCADALMLDIDGFVSETNATNIFMVDDGVLLTPHADHCLPGITREAIIILAQEMGIVVEVRRISLAEFHAADEVFTTGTMGELTPVTMIDGRVIGSGERGPITTRLQVEYSKLPDRDGFATEIPPFE